jgi:lycopene cyclase domain-containing protein
MSLYLSALLFSVSFPVLFTVFFIDLIKEWKKFFLSTFLVATFFIVWNIFFTQHKIWGFNPAYCSGVYVFNLPLEECAFFFIIPFCSLFTHYSVIYLLPKIKLNKKIAQIITVTLMVFASSLVIFNYDKWYTLSTSRLL